MFFLLLSGGQEIPLIDLDGTIVVQLFLFLMLIFLLNRLLYRPYLRLVEARDHAVHGRVREADDFEKRAHARLAELEERLAEARSRGAEERARIRTEAEQREREILSVARDEATRKAATAKEDIARIREDLRAKLGVESEVLARRVASKILGREVH